MRVLKHRLVLFSGPPGVGKSSLSYRLAAETGWALFAKDQLDRTLEQLDIPQRPPTTAYDLMFGLADLNLRSKVSVIFDAVFPRQPFRQRAMDIAAEYGAEFRAIVCVCSDWALWQQRVASRPEVVRGWTPAGWTEVQRVQALYEPWRTPHLLLDAVHPFEKNFARLKEYLQILNQHADGLNEGAKDVLEDQVS